MNKKKINIEAKSDNSIQNSSFSIQHSKFSEAKLEQAFIELLENEGYPHNLGNTIQRNDDEVLIEDDIQNYLLSRYKNQQLSLTEARSIILQIKTLSSSDLYESNKTIMRWLSDGFILKREDRSQKDIHIELIDYKGLNAQRQSAKQHIFLPTLFLKIL